MGCVGAWSLHPAQIDIAKKVFSPDPDEVKFAQKVIEAIPDGRGVHMIDGKMQDDATWKQCRVMVDLAEMLAEKDPELAEAYGLESRVRVSMPLPRTRRRCRLRPVASAERACVVDAAGGAVHRRSPGRRPGGPRGGRRRPRVRLRPRRRAPLRDRGAGRAVGAVRRLQRSYGCEVIVAAHDPGVVLELRRWPHGDGWQIAPTLSRRSRRCLAAVDADELRRARGRGG